MVLTEVVIEEKTNFTMWIGNEQRTKYMSLNSNCSSTLSLFNESFSFEDINVQQSVIENNNKMT